MNAGLLGIIVFFSYMLNTSAGHAMSAPPDSAKAVISETWAYNILKIISNKAKEDAVVRVAVIDDGFRLTHKALADFIYINPNEIAGNSIDDDQNGYVDDISGWDISDNDNDVSIPEKKSDVYFHGTYIAGIITTVFKKCYGDDAGKHLQIIPVKVLSNQAKTTAIMDGYKGIAYAAKLGADIICCAWSGGTIKDENTTILNDAISNGICIVGSAGNFYTEKTDPPSSYPGVICVAALDSLLKKTKKSNFDARVDIAAPGESVLGPYPSADNAYISEDGTSPASAIIAGCLAILKAVKPDANSLELLSAMKHTATAVDSCNLTYCGKLGAGIPNIEKAISFLENPDFRFFDFNSKQPEGTIYYKKKKSPDSWEINPAGAFKGIHFYAGSNDYTGNIKISGNDSVFYDGPVTGFSQGLFIPGSRARIELDKKRKHSSEMTFNYFVETIDSTTLYCKETVKLSSETGTITDGSGADNYSNLCSCQWQITVPEGKRIKIEFTKMKTQANIDFVWIFEGTSTLQENLLAKFSGANMPPVITSFTNNILMWFLTDGSTTDEGWEMKYSAVEQ